ncbi:MAG: PKD domain-containing protein, partial [Sphingobacteriaceae bacterium]
MFMQKARSLPCSAGMATPFPNFTISNYLRHFFSIMLFLVAWNSSSQTVPDPIFFRWDSYVGCIEGDGDMRKTYEELIRDGLCHQVCQNSIVNYTLHSGNNVLTGTVWQVIGGTILSQNAYTCQVKWSSTVTTGSIGVTTNTSTGTIRFPEICVEMKIPPSAQFAMNGNLNPSNPSAPLVICRGTTVNFNNLSSPGSGTPLNSHHWNFGDGNYSTAFEPSYTFDTPGEYTVILTVTNQCYCKSTYARRITVTREAAVPITCASTVCEGERATYSVPASYRCTNFDWSVVGGTIVSPMPYGNTIVVDWVRQGNDSDGEGFGYVTFNPGRCDVSCHEPTTVKIPIIRLNGRINGKTIICGNSQELYKLPQWPTTDFQWEIVNSGGANATLMINGQRNEIMVDTGTEPGSFTLKARYHNTLLECGGTASINVTVKIPAIIEGPRVVCLGD